MIYIREMYKNFRVILRDLFINSIAASYVMPKQLRCFIYKLYGMKIKSANICPKSFFGSNHIDIGEGVFINYNCFFDGSETITIGDHCHIAMEVMFCTSSHLAGTSKKRVSSVYGAPISIGAGSWVGARVTIMPGVTIGPGCVIAAGALVTKDCHPHGLYAGIPAKHIKDLET